MRTLTPAEDVLAQGFAEGSLEGHRLLQVNQMLMKIRSQGQWLACDCRTDALPVMNVTLNSSTGTLFLKNNPGTPDHTADCAFIKDERDPSATSERDEPPGSLAGTGPAIEIDR
ncbi:hypothetical protein D3C85_1501720 [compost metagenome]